MRRHSRGRLLLTGLQGDEVHLPRGTDERYLHSGTDRERLGDFSSPIA